jgi:preprotein translocase SecE subunit
VARDRKRAKQRRERRAQSTRAGATGTRPREQPPREQAPVEHAPPEQAPLEPDVPGALEHASSDVDEFDAALVRGAGGVTATPDEADGAPTAREEVDDEVELTEAPGGGGDDGDGGARDGGRGDGGRGGGDHGGGAGAPLRGGNRAISFLRASWAELQRVQWPDRRHVVQATAVVLGFVAIAGAYLGLADFVAKEIVEFIL